MEPESPGLEQELRQALLREAAALQALLAGRAEEIGAPPLALEQDIDSLVMAASGASDLSKPNEAVGTKRYNSWLIGWVLAAEAAIDVSKEAREQIRLGRYDEDLSLALGPDGLVRLLKEERDRLQHKGAPEPGSGLGL